MRKAREEEPQLITLRSDDAVIVVTTDQYQKLKRKPMGIDDGKASRHARSEKMERHRPRRAGRVQPSPEEVGAGSRRGLRDQVKPGYRDSREAIIAVLLYVGSLPIEHRKTDSKAARILAGGWWRIITYEDHVSSPCDPPHVRAVAQR